jgi:hypothetical protein
MSEAEGVRDTKVRSTKLEPNRSSLSFAAAPPKVLAAKREPVSSTLNEMQGSAPVPSRVCCACGAKDVVSRTNGWEANDEPFDEHSVTIDIRFLKTAAEFTPETGVSYNKQRLHKVGYFRVSASCGF